MDFSNMSPKELRALAKKLNSLARTIELTQDPHKYLKKKANAKIAGAKRKSRNQVLKKLGL